MRSQNSLILTFTTHFTTDIFLMAIISLAYDHRFFQSCISSSLKKYICSRTHETRIWIILHIIIFVKLQMAIPINGECCGPLVHVFTAYLKYCRPYDSMANE